MSFTDRYDCIAVYKTSMQTTYTPLSYKRAKEVVQGIHKRQPGGFRMFKYICLKYRAEEL